MKKLAIFTALLVCLMVAVAVQAENQIITGVVTDKVEAIDKNGNPYTRFIVKWKKELDGLTFDDESVVMAFGDKSVEFDGVQIGDELKAIADYRKLADGRESYTLKKLLQ